MQMRLLFWLCILGLSAAADPVPQSKERNSNVRDLSIVIVKHGNLESMPQLTGDASFQEKRRNVFSAFFRRKLRNGRHLRKVHQGLGVLNSFFRPLTHIRSSFGLETKQGDSSPENEPSGDLFQQSATSPIIKLVDNADNGQQLSPQEMSDQLNVALQNVFADQRFSPGVIRMGIFVAASPETDVVAHVSSTEIDLRTMNQNKIEGELDDPMDLVRMRQVILGELRKSLSTWKNSVSMDVHRNPFKREPNEKNLRDFWSSWKTWLHSTTSDPVPVSDDLAEQPMPENPLVDEAGEAFHEETKDSLQSTHSTHIRHSKGHGSDERFHSDLGGDTIGESSSDAVLDTSEPSETLNDPAYNVGGLHTIQEEDGPNMVDSIEPNDDTSSTTLSLVEETTHNIGANEVTDDHTINHELDDDRQRVYHPVQDDLIVGPSIDEPANTKASSDGVSLIDDTFTAKNDDKSNIAETISSGDESAHSDIDMKRSGGSDHYHRKHKHSRHHPSSPQLFDEDEVTSNDDKAHHHIGRRGHRYRKSHGDTRVSEAVPNNSTHGNHHPSRTAIFATVAVVAAVVVCGVVIVVVRVRRRRTQQRQTTAHSLQFQAAMQPLLDGYEPIPAGSISI